MKFQTRVRVIPLALLAALAAAPAGAQMMPAPPAMMPASPAGAVTASPDYKIADGDVIGVNVVNFPNLSTPQAMVAPGGTVSLPLLDQVSVIGMTQNQVTRLLTTKWRRYVINPVVNVSLIQKHAQIVVLNGYLNHTGTVDYKTDLHLLEALAQIGGALPTADLSKAVLTHADGTKQDLDLSNPQTKAGTDVDVALQPGDILYVPEQKGKVGVVGEVKNPGNLPYKDNLNVLDAINVSGGVNYDTADLYNSTLTHDGVTRNLDLYALMHNGDLHNNVYLAAGDVITIPELHNRTYVFGDVSRQGYYFYKPGDRILDALNSAGVAPDADTGKINVIHTNPDKTLAKMVRVNADDFLLRGNILGNPAVQPGDSLYIPKKHEQFNANTVLQTLTGVGALANTTYLLRTVH